MHKADTMPQFFKCQRFLMCSLISLLKGFPINPSKLTHPYVVVVNLYDLLRDSVTFYFLMH